MDQFATAGIIQPLPREGARKHALHRNSAHAVRAQNADMFVAAVNGSPPPWARSLERVVECHLALNGDLVGRDAALEEVGQLLHILQFHEGERVA
jgi:hypothetical protein